MSAVIEKWLETYFPDYLEQFETEVDAPHKEKLKKNKGEMFDKLKDFSRTEINEWGNSEYNSQVEGAASKLALQDLSTSNKGKKIVRNFQGFMSEGIQIKALSGDKLEQSKQKFVEKMVAKAKKDAEEDDKPFDEVATRKKLRDEVDSAATKNAQKLSSLSVDNGITFDEMVSNRGTIVSSLDARLGDNMTEAYLDPEEMCDQDIRDQRNDIKEQLFLTKKGGERDLGRGRTTWDEATSESGIVAHLTKVKQDYLKESGGTFDKQIFEDKAKVTDDKLWEIGDISEEGGGKKVKRPAIKDYSTPEGAAARLKGLKAQYESLLKKIGKDKDAEVISTLELMSVTTEGGSEHNEELYGKQFGLSKNLLGDPTEHFVKAVRHGKNANVRVPGSLASEIFETLAVPMVGGVSGTTVDFIAVLKDRAKKGKPAMNEKEIEAVAAAFMFSMVGAGHHSLVEMIAGAQQWGYFFDVPNPLTILAQGKTAFDAMRNKGGKVVEDSSFLDKGSTVSLPSYEACLKGFEQYVKGLGIDTSGLLAAALDEAPDAPEKKFDIQNKEFEKTPYQKIKKEGESIGKSIDFALMQGAKTPEPAQRTMASAGERVESLSEQLKGIEGKIEEALFEELSGLVSKLQDRVTDGYEKLEKLALGLIRDKVDAWTKKLAQLAPPTPAPTEAKAKAERAKAINDAVFAMEAEIKNTLGGIERTSIGGEFKTALNGFTSKIAELKQELAGLVPGRKTTDAPKVIDVKDPPEPTIIEANYKKAEELYAAHGKNWFKLKHEFQAGHVSKEDMEMAWAYRKKVVDDYMAEFVNKPFDFAKKNGWDAAGSTNLESDIDISILKHGVDKTSGKKVYDYQIVKAFNDYFMKRFGAQPGIMFDTNLYASAPSEKKGEDHPQTKTEKEISGKMQAGQDVGALMKVRRYMSWDEFEDYRNEILSEMDNAGATKQEKAAVKLQFEQADANYQIAQLAILEKAKKLLDALDVGQRTDEQKTALELLEDAIAKQKDPSLQGQKGQDLLLEAIQKLEKLQDVTMMVNNEIYTERIEEVRVLQEKAEALGQKIEDKKLGPDSPEAAQLADLLEDLSRFRAEAVLFANEAYHSDGPFKHVVLATQAVKGDVEKEYDEKHEAGAFKKLAAEEQDALVNPVRNKRRGELGMDLCLQSFNEQMGDFLKDLKHYAAESPFPGQGFYRSSKYLSRLFDAMMLLDAKMQERSLTLNTGLSDLGGLKKRIDTGMLASRAGKLEFKQGEASLEGQALQEEVEAFAVAEIKAMFGVTDLAGLGGVFKKVTSKVNSQVRKAMATA